MEDKRNAYIILVGKPEEKRLLERPRRMWEDNIKMYIRYGGVLLTGWIWFRIGVIGGLL
jgi:hypothetical protein